MTGLLAGLVLAAAAACTSPATDAPTPAPVPTLAPEGTAPCTVELPQAWAAALSGGVVAPQPDETLVVALGLSDRSVFAVSDVPGVRHALVWRPPGGGPDRTVMDFGLDHPEWQVLAATFDGRHLAYRVDRSYSSFDDFGLYVWDSQGDAAPVEVAHGEPDAKGRLMQTPFVDPVLADGWLYWTQTRDADPGRTVLSGYRLADGHVERLSRGYGLVPVRFGRWLVWPDNEAPGQTSSLRAIDLATHDPATLPAPLAAVRAPSYLAADASTITWVVGEDEQQVWVWRDGWPDARLLVDHVKAPQFPRVAGDTVVWTGEDATWAGDLRSFSAARLTPSYGGVWADGGPVATLAYAPVAKGESSVQALLDTTAVGPLGRAGC